MYRYLGDGSLMTYWAEIGSSDGFTCGAMGERWDIGDENIRGLVVETAVNPPDWLSLQKAKELE
jgi:hypothetical protein